MAVAAGDVFRWTVSGTEAGQVLNNVWFFEVLSIGGPGITAVQVAEALWNHVKVAYRGIATNVWLTAFTSILIEQVDVAAGAYGVYPIPPAEQIGSRAAGTAPADGKLPTFAGGGMRLNVGTKITRPGQKRFWGFTENDTVNQTLTSTATAAMLVLGAILDDDIVLGAPAALSSVAFVVRKTAPDDVPSVNQRVTGVSVSGFVRSQVSRRTKPF